MEHPDEKAEIDVNVKAIIGSVILACIHGVIEIYFMIMESRANKTTFMNYLIICFNGRFGFFPFSDYIGNQNKKEKKEEPENTKTKRVVPENDQEEKIKAAVEILDYDNIKSKAFGIEFPLEYQFSDFTMLGLTQRLSILPII